LDICTVLKFIFSEWEACVTDIDTLTKITFKV